MTKRIGCMLLSLLLMAACCGGLAEGLTLSTVSTFAGEEAGAPAYREILAAWEAETGNYVDDYSAVSDEAWKLEVLYDFAAGNEPDVLFYFANTADSRPILDKVVPVDEINAAYPALNLPETEALREADGRVYAVPVRSFWEGMFVNVDLFERHDLALPTDVQTFETAVKVFNEAGIVPVSVSLSDVPHYILEFLIVSSGPVTDHQARPAAAEDIPAAWTEGMALLSYLYGIGAFAENATFTSEDLASNLFRTKQAAMQLDGSWFANGIPEESWDSTIVMPFPAYSEAADPTATIGGATMGFYITRRAWADEARRDAAVSLLSALTSDAAKERLGFSFGGAMLESAQTMVNAAVENNSLCFPIQDEMDPDARAHWFNNAPALAEGTADPAELLREVIEKGAFGAK